MATISAETLRLVEKYQLDEVTGHAVYLQMARGQKNEKNRRVLNQIAAQEKRHATIWKRYTGRDIQPSKWKLAWYRLLGVVLGYTFVIKLMENGEAVAADQYRRLIEEIPEMKEVMEQEEAHEYQLHDMLNEERLQYVGAMVLGLNDALVELTGTIAGLTFALGNNRVVALAGIITGVSATLSMAASNYLAERADGNPNAFKSCLYTGVAYLITVILLVLPYMLYPSHMIMAALATMIAVVILIILFFNYYISVAKSLPFLRRFGEMLLISLGVALISFFIGLVAKQLLDVDL
ncbi:MAG: VIT1/CCC1 transporter family protein [Planctomycetes bacterium]|nr:VIT1/CCC1 transporter family protein [Planctomycetota bacterium]